MRIRIGVVLCLGACILPGQLIPNRYIVELDGEPVAAVQARLGIRPRETALRPEAVARRTQIAAEQARLRRVVESRGGRVLASMDTALNALAVEIAPGEARQLATSPGVARVIPDRVYRARLDRVLPLSNVPQAFALAGGAEKAGLGVGVAILDSGIDSSHPGFKDESLAAPDGYPRASSEANRALVTNKVIVARSYEDLADDPGYGKNASDGHGHGTNAACAAACVVHRTNLGTISGVAPKAWLGNYKVLGNNGSGPSSAIIKGIDDAMKDGFDVLNLSLGSDFAGDPAEDGQVRALERAVAAGHIVVVAAGNAGPDENTVGSPATTPNCIAVGSSSSDRTFDSSGVAPIDPNRLSEFSSRGPNLGVGLKPDLLATGDNFFTATTTLKNPEVFYTVTQGTSFAAPTVAGAAAFLKSARPNLTEAQYRSLIINSARAMVSKDGKPAPVRHQGAGVLNAEAAMRSTVAAAPTSWKIGVGGGTADIQGKLAVTNLGSASGNFRVSVEALDGRTAPQLEGDAAAIASGATGTFNLRFSGSDLSGEYQGVVLVATDQNDVVARIPYWYAVRSAEPKAITLLEARHNGAAGGTVSFGVRIVDGSGLDVEGVKLTVSAVSGGGEAKDVGALEGVPMAFGVSVKLAAGENVFRLSAGDVSRTITITGE